MVANESVAAPARQNIKHVLKYDHDSFHDRPGWGQISRREYHARRGVIQPPRTYPRRQLCPFLLRIFISIGSSRATTSHHKLELFNQLIKPLSAGQELDSEAELLSNDELEVYTWPDATLRELTDLVKDVLPEAREPGTRLEFQLISFVKNGTDVVAQSQILGSVTSNRMGPCDRRTLASFHFTIGDFIDLTLTNSSRQPNICDRGATGLEFTENDEYEHQEEAMMDDPEDETKETEKHAGMDNNT